MTPEELQKKIQQLLPHLDLPGVETPSRLLRALENEVEHTPLPDAFWPLLHQVNHLVRAQEGLPHIVGTVRFERLVRWTNWSVSFDGADIHTGESIRVRTLRAHNRTDPFYKRQLFREGTALKTSGLTPALYFSNGSWPAIAIPLSGPPLEDSPTPSGHTERSIWSIRILGTALGALVRWEQSPLHLPALSNRELRLTENGLDIQCLSPASEQRPNLEGIAHAILTMYGEDVSAHIEPLLHGLIDFPHSTPTDIANRLVEGLSDALAELRHDIVLQRHHKSRESRLERLRHWVKRLAKAQQPPAGRGALGINLDGETTVVSGRPGELRWGTAENQPATIWNANDGLAVREARRVLRSFSVAPYNARLNRQIGGDPDYVDHVCRWLNGALELRTLVLLLEKQS